MYRYAVRVPQHVPRASMGVYTRHAFSLLPENVLRQAFDVRDVKLDGVRVGRDQPVRPGAEVAVYTPYKARLPILYEDDRILAVDKPAGVSCDADAYGSLTVQDWAAIGTEGAYTPRLCHRLDNPTSGLLLLAKDEAAEEALKAMFARHAGDKTYVCIVRGAPKPVADTCHAWLIKDALHARVRVLMRETPQAKPITTAYQTLQAGAASLLQVRLLTGRTHQIRAHMASLGHPVLGDDLYGDRDFNRAAGSGGLMLRSVGLRIDTQGALPHQDGLTLTADCKLDRLLQAINQRLQEST